jgi:hypothetical protein
MGLFYDSADDGLGKDLVMTVGRFGCVMVFTMRNPRQSSNQENKRIRNFYIL